MHISRVPVALTAHSSTDYVASTNETCILCSRPGFGCTSPNILKSRNRVWAGRVHSGVVVVMGFRSSAAN